MLPLLLACASPAPPGPAPAAPLEVPSAPATPDAEPERVQEQDPTPVPSGTASMRDRFSELHDFHQACTDAKPYQQGLNYCSVQNLDLWTAKVAELETRLAALHSGAGLSSAWRAHRDAEFAWLDGLYGPMDGSMWPMVLSGHKARLLEDRALELAYDLCEPRPVYEAAEDCYSDAIGPKYDAFVLCDEAVYDADLNAAWKQLTGALGAERTEKLRASQRLWLAHRDVDTPVCSKMTQNPARALRVRHRVEQLRRYLDFDEIGGD